MPTQTILTSFGASGLYTSTLTAHGAGIVHVQFRVGSAVSAPVISNMSMVMHLLTKMPGSDDMWIELQTWSVAAAEVMPGRDYSYYNPEQSADFKFGCKTYQSGHCQGRLWEG